MLRASGHEKKNATSLRSKPGRTDKSSSFVAGLINVRCAAVATNSAPQRNGAMCHKQTSDLIDHLVSAQ
jgi:hypothetical protein